MEELREIFAALCGITVLCSAQELLIPEGTVKRYARFVFSLATIALLLRPILILLEYLTESGT